MNKLDIIELFFQEMHQNLKHMGHIEVSWGGTQHCWRT